MASIGKFILSAILSVSRSELAPQGDHNVICLLQGNAAKIGDEGILVEPKKHLDDLVEGRWVEFAGTYAAGYADGISTRFASLELAQRQCMRLGVEYCKAVTCTNDGDCTIRKTATLSHSDSKEITYTLEDAPLPVSACDTRGGCFVFNNKNVVVFDGKQISLLQSTAPTAAMDVASGTNATNSTMPVANANHSTLDEKRMIKFIKESNGEVWLVKSTDIHIQARYAQDTRNATINQRYSVRSFAVGGPFLNGSTLVVGGLNSKVTWNGESILQKEDSDFLADGFISARRSNFSCSVQRDALQKVNGSYQQGGIDIALPKGVKITVNRLQDSVNLRIVMPAPLDGQEGLCGNNNGDPTDDDITFIIKTRPVINVGESLLPAVGMLSKMFDYFR